MSVQNPYLRRKMAEYKKIQDTLSGYAELAQRTGRDLSDEELSTVRSLKADATKLADEIETLTDIEAENNRVADMRRKIAFDTTVSSDQVRGTSLERGVDAADEAEAGTRSARLGGATTKDRDPGHYRKHGRHSFFADAIRARQQGDEAAATRLVQHARALDTTDGAGVIPPKWLLDEYSPLARQGRKLANVVRKIDITGDPRPIVLPAQTTGADNTLNGSTSVPGTQVGGAENGALPGTDKWASTTATVTPVTIGGYQLVSRQLLDSATSAVDSLIFADLVGAYDAQVEKRLGTAILAAGPTALAASEGPSVAITSPTHFARVAVRAGLEVRKNRHLPAQLLAMSVGRYGDFLDLYDSTGRPLLPGGNDGPMNVVGIGSIAVDGRLRDLGIVATDGVTTDAEFAAFRPQDVILFESDLMRFRFEEVNGPESIRLGIWAYVAATVRYASTSVQTVEVTEES